MMRNPDQPGLGWAVRLSPEEIHCRQARSDRFHRLATGKHLVLAVLIVWNLWGLACLVGSLQSSDIARPVVLTAVIWMWLLGDIAVVCSSLLIRRFRHGKRLST
jgi:hypothetical protein